MQKTRYSKQRELIYKNLKNRCDHPTAEDIYASLKKDNPTLSLGTVYRNLNFLVEAKVVQKLQMGKQTVHYDVKSNPHYHFICQTCHKIYDIDADTLHSLIIEELKKENSHFVMSTDITLRGICEQCQDAEDEEPKL